ncbi:hypothetical protein BJY01DRAFT_252308 [Aspergillus pseudoustus]|uniref:Caspase domain-containing protein n=1 Tax=Aspergillus pseudoustus TaxID=1810923 RepID=A0ABR4J750_9EURO
MQTSPSKWAILVGTDYLPVAYDDDGTEPETFYACVADVEKMSSCLQEAMSFPEQNIFKLTYSPSSPGNSRPLPTYNSVLDAFRRIGDESSPGDVVYIHFSVGCSQVPSVLTTDQPSRPQDEGFALLDNETGSSRRYLHDLELAVLINRLSVKGLDVTLVLDLRGIGTYTGPRDRFRESAFSQDDLQSMFHGVRSPRGQDTQLRNPDVRFPYALVSGRYWNGFDAHSNEYREPQSKRYHGFLTYWLLHILDKYGRRLTCNDIVRQVSLETDRLRQSLPTVDGVRVEAHGTAQRLFLQGMDGRQTLAGRVLFPGRLVRDSGGCDLRIEAGSAQGVNEGVEAVFVAFHDQAALMATASLDVMFRVYDVSQFSSSAAPSVQERTHSSLDEEFESTTAEIHGLVTILPECSTPPRQSHTDLFRSRLSLQGNSPTLLSQIHIYAVEGYRYTTSGSSKLPPVRSPTRASDGCLHLLTGDYATIYLSHIGNEPIYLHILHFDTAALGITQVEPKTYHQSRNSVEHRSMATHLTFDLRLSLPLALWGLGSEGSFSSAAAYIKVIVTNRPTSFHSLELPSALPTDRGPGSVFENEKELLNPNAALFDEEFIRAHSARPSTDLDMERPISEENWCCINLKFVIHRTPESLAAV